MNEGAHDRHDIEAFVTRVMSHADELYRDFTWRTTTDPYAIWLSEVMLQQTQVVRVISYFDRWMRRFPTVDALASASTSDVLESWQGLGYNRRALMLKRAAGIISTHYDGIFPDTYAELVTLPGIGPATAAGILAFAFNTPAPYLETNVRTVVLHELFPDETDVSDRDVRLIVEQASEASSEAGIDPRRWNYALLDYGAWLKKTFPNPSRRSKHHTRQSTFEGSRRQKRAALLRLVLDTPGLSADAYADLSGYDPEIVADILADLTTERFLRNIDDRYQVD